jgi:hypothetical protein
MRRARALIALSPVLAALIILPPTLKQLLKPSSPQSGGPVIAAAGDIACSPDSRTYRGGAGAPDSCRQQTTADLVAGINPVAVLVLGDNQYESGTLNNYQTVYASTWGRFKSITYPAVGNHEYLTQRAAGYYDYFGSTAGPSGLGYYSFDIGKWHLIALNSSCSAVHGCGFGSPQEQWLKQDLASHNNTCVLAYWHQPRFSSGYHGNDAKYDAFWQDLYAAGADLVLNGHDHDYERFAPQNPNGLPDPTRGIREFIVGTGGENHRPFAETRLNSEVRNNDTFGVLKLTLNPGSYAWQFVGQQGSTFSDSGTGTCH